METLVPLQYYQAKLTTLRSNHYLRAFRPCNIFYVDFYLSVLFILLFFLFIVIFITEERINCNLFNLYSHCIIVNYELYCFIDLLIDENITEKENDAENFFLSSEEVVCYNFQQFLEEHYFYVVILNDIY